MDRRLRRDHFIGREAREGNSGQLVAGSSSRFAGLRRVAERFGQPLGGPRSLYPCGDSRVTGARRATVAERAGRGTSCSRLAFGASRVASASLARKTSRVDLPETRFAKSGDVHVAYKAFGRGRFDVVFVGGLEYTTVEGVEIPPMRKDVRAFLTQAGPLMRFIRFDKRGTGSSDRVAGVPSLEERMDDVRAVMDAVGSEAAALFGQVDGAAMSLLFAATYPERTFALVLWQPKPRFVWAPDFPWAPTRDEYERTGARVVEAWVTKGSIAEMRRWGV